MGTYIVTKNFPGKDITIFRGRAGILSPPLWAAQSVPCLWPWTLYATVVWSQDGGRRWRLCCLHSFVKIQLPKVVVAGSCPLTHPRTPSLPPPPSFPRLSKGALSRIMHQRERARDHYRIEPFQTPAFLGSGLGPEGLGPGRLRLTGACRPVFAYCLGCTPKLPWRDAAPFVWLPADTAPPPNLPLQRINPQIKSSVPTLLIKLRNV